MRFYQLFFAEYISPTIGYLFIVLAGIDFTSVLDYVMKAALGSAVWFLFRVLGDYYSAKIKRHINHNKQNPKNNKPE